MKRLTVLKKRKILAVSMPSKPTLSLHGFMTKAGLYYEYTVRLLGNRLMYSIVCHDRFETSSLYDGDDFEKSFELYCELMLALHGVNFAENFARTKQQVLDKIDSLKDKGQDMTLKMKPLFLGDSDFANS